MGTFGSTFSNTGSRGVTAPIPLSADAFVWLDGTIVDISGTKYFVDKSGHGRNFLITNYDFDSTWTKGFPYKSAATISAPAGDTTLQAADINSFLYTAGTPNQIPVVSLFQDIDYEHKIFARHEAQILDINNVETYEPRVRDIVLYNTVKAGGNLTSCQSYFGVPTEQTSSVVWLSPTGNDTTGTGTKASPYRSLDKIKATSSGYVYLKTGTYDKSETSSFTGSALVVQGLGLCSYGLSASANISAARPIKFNNLIVNGNCDSYANYSNSTIEYNNCKLTKTNGIAFTVANTSCTSVIYKNCILDCTFSNGVVKSLVATLTNVKIIGCIGRAIVTMPTTLKPQSFEVTYNKIINGYIGGASTYAVQTTASYNTSVNGKLVLISSNNMLVRYNNLSAPINDYAISLQADINANLTGVDISNNTFMGNTAGYLIYIGASNNDFGFATAKFWSNTVTNTFTATQSTTLYSILLYGSFDVRYNKVYGADLYVRGLANTYVANNYIDSSTSINTIDRRAFVMLGTASAGVTGILIENNTFLGCAKTAALVVVGSDNELNTNWSSGTKFFNNKVVNKIVGGTIADSGHTTFFHSGIDYSVKWNDITMQNGHGMVVKSGGASYVTTDEHISYNVFRSTGASWNVIWNRGTVGLRFCNNTILDFSGLRVFNIDDNAPSGFAHSIFISNNLVKLGGSVGDFYNGDSITGRNNYVNKNGYAFTNTGVGVNDFETLVSINSSTGLPSSVLPGETFTGSNNVGLDVSTIIPATPVYKNQPSSGAWQVGAYVQ